jgi:DNA-binding HxlR family transcriptional regulator
MDQQFSTAIPLIQLLAGRWTIAMLTKLADSGHRYQDLHDSLDGISYKVLTETLRRAERDGLIARHLDGGRVETATLYELTALGQSLSAPLEAMAVGRGQPPGGRSGSRELGSSSPSGRLTVSLSPCFKPDLGNIATADLGGRGFKSLTAAKCRTWIGSSFLASSQLNDRL